MALQLPRKPQNIKVLSTLIAVFALVVQPFVPMMSEIVSANDSDSSPVSYIAFSTPEVSVDVGNESTPITITSYSESGEPASVGQSGFKITVTSSSGTGEFIRGGSASSAISSVTYNSNWTNFNFIYRDSTPGTHQLGATLTNNDGITFVAESQNIIVKSNEASEPIVPVPLPESKISEGTTKVSDVIFSKANGNTALELNFTLDENGYITGEAKNNLVNQEPAPGFEGRGYHEVVAEKPSSDVTHVKFEWLDKIVKLGASDTLEHAIRPYVPVATDQGDDNWTPVSNRKYELNIRWYSGPSEDDLVAIETLDINVFNRSTLTAPESYSETLVAKVEPDATYGWKVTYENFYPRESSRILWQRTNGTIVEVPHSGTRMLYLNRTESPGTVKVYYLLSDGWHTTAAEYDDNRRLFKVNEEVIDDYVDTVEPGTILNTPEGAVGSTFTVSGEASDNLSLNRVTLQIRNRETKIRYGDPVALNLIGQGKSAEWSYTYNAKDLNLPDGSYEIHATVVDRANNRSESGWMGSFTVDTSAPIVTDVKVDNPATGEVEIRATIVDPNGVNLNPRYTHVRFYRGQSENGADVSSSNHKLELVDGSDNEYVATIDTTKFAPNGTSGTYWIYFRTQDNLGNAQGNNDTRDIVVDNTSQVQIENFNTHNGEDYQGLNVGFNIDRFDVVSSVMVKLYRNDAREPFVINTGTSALLSLINDEGELRHSTPFAFGDIDNDPYWTFGEFDWTSMNWSAGDTISAEVVVTDSKGRMSWDLIEGVTEANGITVATLIANEVESQKKTSNGSESTRRPTRIPTSPTTENNDGQAEGGIALTPIFQSAGSLNTPTETIDSEAGSEDVDEEVLGATTPQNTRQLASTDTSDESQPLLGLAWYWWVVIAAGVVLAGWLVGRFRAAREV